MSPHILWMSSEYSRPDGGGVLTNQPLYGYNITMIQRNISESLAEAMADTPVVLLNGARQTGKSTLAKWHTDNVSGGRYLTLDDATVLAAATADPAGFLSGFDGPVVLDEVQHAPGLFPAIKAKVDRDRRSGRFLLTGSADVLLLPNLSESLAGRMEILTLWPFSAGELIGSDASFIDRVFSEGNFASSQSLESRQELLQRIITGGFPEAISRKSARRRNAWFGSYITTILQRDIRELSNIEHLTLLPRMLSLLATRSSCLLNYAELSRSLGLPQSTLKRYMALLETTFLVQVLPPWSANLGKRLVKSPKIMLCDTGLMAYLLGVDSNSEIPEHALGALVENYVVMELRKQLGWSSTRTSLFHFRERTGKEVDVVLENAAGQVVGIEVKASSTVAKSDLKHLKFMRESLGDRFLRGVVLYLGTEQVSFDDTLQAVPLGVL
jgi:predicted AAA+ superfamily ATPase